MRIGKNEKKVLLMLLSAKDMKLDRPTYMYLKWNLFPDGWSKKHAVILSQTLTSLRRKGLMERKRRCVLTDEGEKIAQTLLAETEGYISEWRPYTSSIFKKNLEMEETNLAVRLDELREKRRAKLRRGM